MRRDWEVDQLRSELDDVDVHAPIVDPPSDTVLHSITAVFSCARAGMAPVDCLVV